MATLVKAQIRQFLHDYKKRVFELEHDPKIEEARRTQLAKYVTEVLSEKSRFKFHQKVDKSQAETLDLIYDFCHEAILPPVVTKLAERVVVLESRQPAFLEMVQKVLEALSQEEKVGV